MKTTTTTWEEMMAIVPPEVNEELRLSFAISDRIDELMREHGLSKKQFADVLGRRPCEVTKWLSGQHNFTLKTIAMISAFFGKPIVNV